MDEVVLNRVANFGISLKNSAHLLIHQGSVLSLELWNLYEIEQAFSLILEVEKHTNFNVLPPNHRHHPAIPHLQFIYDVFQKISKLFVWTRSYRPLLHEQSINLRCFRNLQKLEIDHIPLCQIKGMQNLRPTLKILVVNGISGQLQDLFHYCGADKSKEYTWDKLNTAVITHNSIRILDNSLKLLPQLQILDLSHCELIDASALVYLPIVSKLNLSYNMLKKFPNFSEGVRYNLLTLNLSNNYFMEPKGIEGLPNLEHLNMTNNVLTLPQTMCCLKALPCLKSLQLMGNPINFSKSYRHDILKALNPAVITSDDFTLDKKPIQVEEIECLAKCDPMESVPRYPAKLLASMKPCGSVPFERGSEHSSFGCSLPVSFLQQTALEPVIKNFNIGTLQHSSNKDSSNESLNQKKVRKRRTRHVVIHEPSELVGSEASAVNYLASSISELSIGGKESPKAEPVINTKKSENEDKLVFFSPSHVASDKLLEEILDNSMLENDPLRTAQPFSLHMNVPSPTCPQTQEPNEAIDDFYSSNAMADNAVADISFSPRANGDEPGVIRALVTKCNTQGGSNAKCYLVISKNCIREKDLVTNKTLEMWGLSTLESMEILSMNPYKIRLGFTSVREERHFQSYSTEEKSFQEIQHRVNNVLEEKLLSDSSNATMNCLKCDASFSKALAVGNKVNNETLYSCPNCNSGTIILVPSEEHKAASSANNSATAAEAKQESKQKPGVAKNSTNGRKPSTASIGCASPPMCPGESSESVSVCSESSSNHRRESDVEVISNPSLCSFEAAVIQEQQNAANPLLVQSSSPLDKSILMFEAPVAAAFNSDARTPPTNTHMHSQKSNPNMQESSSSGSLTGSACTAFDPSSSDPDVGLSLQSKQKLSNNQDSECISAEAEKENSVIDTNLPCSAKSNDTICELSKEGSCTSEDSTNEMANIACIAAKDWEAILHNSITD